MKVAICASECVPFAKTGGLADVVGALPLALEQEKQDVVIIIPGYKAVRNSGAAIKKFKEGVSYSVIGENIRVYFLENDAYFNRDQLYGDKNGDYKDNLERFSFFCNRALTLLKELDFKADIIHVHDWQASLIPVYLKAAYKKDAFFRNTRSVLTIHNLGYQGIFGKEEFPNLGLDWSLFGIEGLEFYDKINLLKGGIIFSDIINTVSPNYAREIQTKKFGFGLEGVLTERKDSLFGILNGIDYSIWNPETDKHIFENFSLLKLQGKLKNKSELQKYCGLPVNKDVPLVGMVSRLAEPKGFDILAKGIGKVCSLGLQLVILGTGDLKYHLLLGEIAKKFPKVVSLHLKFDDQLAHRIYAGSDIFLMPSSYEPCGLGQLISLRYGSIPLVFKTGGLADTVNKENGFVFDEYSAEALIKALKQAITAFGNSKQWEDLAKKAMKCNFSWEESAKRYVELYEKAKSS